MGKNKWGLVIKGVFLYLELFLFIFSGFFSFLDNVVDRGFWWVWSEVGFLMEGVNIKKFVKRSFCYFCDFLYVIFGFFIYIFE